MKPYNHNIELRTCHDIRKLSGCTYCGGMGWKQHMIPIGSGRSKEYAHGRCYISAHGLSTFLSLSKTVTNELFLCDIGDKAMRALMERR